MIPLRDVRRQIQSVRKIGHITRAMKTVSAIRLLKVQSTVTQQRPYALKLREIVTDLVARTATSAHPLLQAARANDEVRMSNDESQIVNRQSSLSPVVCLVLGSDRGLCGPFNNNLMAASLKFQNERPGREVQTVAFGKKLIDLMQSHHRPMNPKLPGFFQTSSYLHSHSVILRPVSWRLPGSFQGMTYDTVAALARDYLEQYLAGRIGELWAVYTEFRSTARQRVKAEQILPIGRGGIPAEPLFPEYAYEPTPFEVLDRLLPQYYLREVWRIFLESTASEHMARMLAMDMATVNAGEMIEGLTLVLNKARQELITRELSEISTSAEALRAS
jgi:F-type H+-transporting ATPase subunit gamma